MRKVKSLIFGLLVFSVLFFTTTVYADQVKVNIVYPINGASYPITDPSPGKLNSAYFTSSFSVTCSGDRKVEWGFDGSPAIGRINVLRPDKRSVRTQAARW